MWEDHQAFTLANMIARNFIFDAVEPSILEMITNVDLARDIWAALEKICLEATVTDLQGVLARLEYLTLSQDGTVEDLVEKVSDAKANLET